MRNAPSYVSPNKSINLELIEIGTLYSLTISPNDDHQYWDDPLRFMNFKLWFTKMFITKTGLPYKILEARIELSKFGRLHVHGFIQFKRPVEFLLKYIRQWQNMSIFEIDTIDPKTIEVYKTYVNKQNRAMQNESYNNDANEYKLKEKTVIANNKGCKNIKSFITAPPSG